MAPKRKRALVRMAPKKLRAGTTQVGSQPAYSATNTIASANQFAILADDIQNPPTARNITVNNRATKQPPIIVESSALGDVHKKIISAGVVDYTTKFTKNGIAVFTNTKKDYKAVMEKLTSQKSNFFTFQPEDEKTTKVVLQGLCKSISADLEEELRSLSIFPSSIKELTIKHKRYDDQITLLLHFPKGSINLQTLKETKFLQHCRVFWSYYSKNSSPMQCKNCQKYGHGANNCHSIQKCVKCAEPHPSKDCPLNDSPARIEGIIPARLLKCANCNGNHPATFSKCPARPTQGPKPQTKKQPNKKPPPSVDLSSFPLLPNVSSNSHQNIHDWSKNYAPTQTQQQKSSPDKEGLFDQEEIVQIVQETFTCPKKCRTKEDQIMVIFRIIQKYCQK
uniref:Putative rhomboid n=1 Tax=Anopheles darlingi TaxID=43151 RepID=A0A2M4CJF0_ANODA